MGDENPIRTLGDNSKNSHGGYRIYIELPAWGNNVGLVPLYLTTISVSANDAHSRGFGPRIQTNTSRIFLNLWTHSTLTVKIGKERACACFNFPNVIKLAIGLNVFQHDPSPRGRILLPDSLLDSFYQERPQNSGIETPLLVGRGFLATANAVIDCRMAKIMVGEGITRYGKIWYDEDVHDLRSVETEFPAIVFNDELSSEKTLSCEPTVSSLNNKEIDFRISFDESNDEDCTPKVSSFDDLDFFKDFENEFPAIVYNDALTSKSDFLTKPTLSPQHIDEFDLKDEISLSEYDEVEQDVLYFNDLFPFNITIQMI
ncbi:hypothetical protein Tco_0605777 [Tanacetum coccineum]